MRAVAGSNYIFRNSVKRIPGTVVTVSGILFTMPPSATRGSRGRVEGRLRLPSIIFTVYIVVKHLVSPAGNTVILKLLVLERIICGNIQ